MHRIEEVFLHPPFCGNRQMARQVRRDGACVSRHRVRRLMRLMGLDGIHQAPGTGAPHPAHGIHPHLLKGLTIERPDHLWCADMTGIPVQRGVLHQVAGHGPARRHVRAWRLSNTMGSIFRVAALNDAPGKCGTPEPFNADKAAGSPALTSPVCSRGRRSPSPWLAGSMVGRGRCMDTIFIERLWRSMKDGAVCLHDLTDGFRADG